MNRYNVIIFALISIVNNGSLYSAAAAAAADAAPEPALASVIAESKSETNFECTQQTEKDALKPLKGILKTRKLHSSQRVTFNEESLSSKTTFKKLKDTGMKIMRCPSMKEIEMRIEARKKNMFDYFLNNVDIFALKLQRIPSAENIPAHYSLFFASTPDGITTRNLYHDYMDETFKILEQLFNNIGKQANESDKMKINPMETDSMRPRNKFQQSDYYKTLSPLGWKIHALLKTIKTTTNSHEKLKLQCKLYGEITKIILSRLKALNIDQTELSDHAKLSHHADKLFSKNTKKQNQSIASEAPTATSIAIAEPVYGKSLALKKNPFTMNPTPITRNPITPSSTKQPYGIQIFNWAKRLLW